MRPPRAAALRHLAHGLKGLFVAAAIAAGLQAPATAADSDPNFPSRPVKLMLPFGAGGTGDIFSRLVSAKFQLETGQPMVIENKGGAGGVIATDLVAHAPPDGYTLLLAAGAQLANNPALYKKVPYDPIRDFAPVALLGSTTNVIVASPTRPERTLADLLAEAKAHPGQISFGSSGLGSTPHLAGELLKLRAGVQMVHIPYSGGGPALTAILGNQVPVSVIAISSVLPSIKAGRLRALAVTGLTRSPALPDVPAVAETLPGFDAVGWFGILAPAGTPPAVVERLHTVLRKITGMPDVRAAWEAQAIDVQSGSSADFTTYVASEVRKAADIVKRSGITLDP